MIAHVKVKKRDWGTTVFVSIIIGLTIILMIAGILSSILLFGGGMSRFIQMFSQQETQAFFILGWVIFSFIAFLFILDSNEFTYTKIVHKETK